MSKINVLAISGSPSSSSKTALIADYILSRVKGDGVNVDHIRLSTLDATALLRGDMTNPGIMRLVSSVANAHGVVVATPIFKASFSGLLKVSLDILPQFSLAGKVVLPMGTGGSVAHVLALDYALRPVLQSMGSRHIVQSHFIVEKEIDLTNPIRPLSAEASLPLMAVIRNFSYSLTSKPEVRQLGHPRPDIDGATDAQ